MDGLKSDLNGFGGISENVSITKLKNSYRDRIRYPDICLFIFSIIGGNQLEGSLCDQMVDRNTIEFLPVSPHSTI